LNVRDHSRKEPSVDLLELAGSNSLYTVLATGAIVTALAFGIGRSILLAQVTSAEKRRAQFEESASTWRNKAERLEHELAEVGSQAQRELRKRLDHIAALEDSTKRERADRQVHEDELKRRNAELESALNERDHRLAQQERDFRERVARMTSEMKAVMTRLSSDNRAA
jgi:septal ring factor EnvC (AmiA/AmiB activator)